MAQKRSFQCMAAVTQSFGIGKGGALPFSLPGDHTYLLELTGKTRHPSLRNAVIIGRIGYMQILRDLPKHQQPLPGRLVIVLTKSPPVATAAAFAAGVDGHAQQQQEQQQQQQQQSLSPQDDVLYASSLEAAMQLIEDPIRCAAIDTVFVLGGEQIFKEAVKSDRCSALHITHVEVDPDCDRFFPDITAAGSPWKLWSSSAPQFDGGVRYQFTCYTRQPVLAPQLLALDCCSGPVPLDSLGGQPVLPAGMSNAHAEGQLLELVRSLAAALQPWTDRASRSGVALRFDLRRCFPLMTVGCPDWPDVCAKVLSLLTGRTRESSSSSSTSSQGMLTDPAYSWQSSDSRMCSSCGTSPLESSDGQLLFRLPGEACLSAGCHQLLQGIMDSATSPCSSAEQRSLCGWDPSRSKQSCSGQTQCSTSITAQFNVVNGELTCHLHQSCGDLLEHLPFNIACYALLTCCLAKAAQLAPGDLYYTLAEATLERSDMPRAEAAMNTRLLHFPGLMLTGGSPVDDDSIMSSLLAPRAAGPVVKAVGLLGRGSSSSSGDMASSQLISSGAAAALPWQLQDQIYLKGLVMHGYHGARPEENVLGQKFMVDATLWADLSAAGRSDRLDDTFDYTQASRVIENVVQGPFKALQEAVAEEICQQLLQLDERVSAVEVYIRKPQVPLAGVMESIGVKIFRVRK